MTASTTKLIALSLCGALGLTSCHGLDPHAFAHLPGHLPLPHHHGRFPGGLRRHEAALVAAGALVVTAIIVASYRANQRQKEEAEARARAELARPRVREQVRKKKVRYVAVPVRRAEGKGGSSQHLMKVNAETGKPTGEVFVPQEGQKVSNGNVVKLGGDEALYYGNVVHGV